MNWKEPLKNFVNTPERLNTYVNLSKEERAVLSDNKTNWGTTPHFTAMMDKDDPNCPIRKQVIPSAREKQNCYG